MSAVDDFKAKLRGGGARPNLFKATINFPAYAGGDVELTSFMCKGASLPSSVIGQIDLLYRGRQVKLPGDRTFEPWTVTVINDTGMEVRDALERWSNGINGHESNTGVSNPLDYEADLVVEQLDRNGETIKTYKIVGAFPTNVSAIELSNDTTDTIEEFTVEFSYQYWTSNTTS